MPIYINMDDTFIISVGEFIHNNRDIVIIILFSIIGSIIGTFLLFCLIKYINKQKYRKTLMKGEKGEIKAIKLLKRENYKIIEKQPQSKSYMWVNGEMHHNNIRADYILLKNNKKYICEVKTGDTVGNYNYISTRRQLLEYYLYFDMPVIFVDVVNKTIYEIEFGTP